MYISYGCTIGIDPGIQIAVQRVYYVLSCLKPFKCQRGSRKIGLGRTEGTD